jgi:two-component system alkaline phosphatase synthesis response regulator PhoP
MRDVVFISKQYDVMPEGNRQLSRDFKFHYFSKITDAGSVIHSIQPALVVIDIDNQELEAFEFSFLLKNDHYPVTLPVILLSSSTDPKKEIEAFRTGADDFILKPLHGDAFAARLNARCVSSKERMDFKISESKRKLQIDKESFAVYLDNELVSMSRKEFELLHLLASQPGKAFTRNEIFQKVWKRKPDDQDRTIDVHILRLRKKLGNDFISTQKGVGYRLII